MTQGIKYPSDVVLLSNSADPPAVETSATVHEWSTVTTVEGSELQAFVDQNNIIIEQNNYIISELAENNSSVSDIASDGAACKEDLAQTNQILASTFILIVIGIALSIAFDFFKGVFGNA